MFYLLLKKWLNGIFWKDLTANSFPVVGLSMSCKSLGNLSRACKLPRDIAPKMKLITLAAILTRSSSTIFSFSTKKNHDEEKFTYKFGRRIIHISSTLWRTFSLNPMNTHHLRHPFRFHQLRLPFFSVRNSHFRSHQIIL